MTLLRQINADAYKAILVFKQDFPNVADQILDSLEKHDHWSQLSCTEMLDLVQVLPFSIWDRDILTLYLVFESQQTTTMP